jgi:hypothetical protein
MLEYFMHVVCVCVICLETKFWMHSFRGSLFVAVNRKAKENFFFTFYE